MKVEKKNIIRTFLSILNYNKVLNKKQNYQTHYKRN